MNLTVNLDNNTNFNAKRIKYTKNQMTEILKPMVDVEFSVKEMMKHSGLSRRNIENWVLETYDQSIPKLYKNKHDTKLREELELYKSVGLTDEEIGTIYNSSAKWINTQLNRLGIIAPIKRKIRLLDEKGPDMVHSGYPIPRIAEELQLSQSKIASWVKNRYSKTILQVRKENSIKINKSLSNEKLNLLQKVYDCIIIKGYGILETAKELNIRKQKVYNFMKIMNLTSHKQDAKKLMEQKVPEMIKEGKTLQEMSKEIGLSGTTIGRYIRKITGKRYFEIKQTKML